MHQVKEGRARLVIETRIRGDPLLRLRARRIELQRLEQIPGPVRVELIEADELVRLPMRPRDLLRRQDHQEALAIVPLDDLLRDRQALVEHGVHRNQPLRQREIIRRLPLVAQFPISANNEANTRSRLFAFFFARPKRPKL
jgi:hypothetical protein